MTKRRDNNAKSNKATKKVAKKYDDTWKVRRKREIDRQRLDKWFDVANGDCSEYDWDYNAYDDTSSIWSYSYMYANDDYFKELCSCLLCLDRDLNERVASAVTDNYKDIDEVIGEKMDDSFDVAMSVYKWVFN